MHCLKLWIVLRCSTSRLDYLQLQPPLTHRTAGTAGLVRSEIPVGISHAAAKCKMNLSFRLSNTQVLDTGFGLLVLLWTFLGLHLLISRHSVSISTHWFRRNGPSMFHCATRLSSTLAAAHTSRRRDRRAGPQWSPVSHIACSCKVCALLSQSFAAPYFFCFYIEFGSSEHSWITTC